MKIKLANRILYLILSLLSKEISTLLELYYLI